MFQQAVDKWKELRGPRDPKTLESTLNLASVLADLGRLDEAKTLARDVLEASRTELGETHQVTAFAHYQLAAIAALDGRKTDALLSLRAAKASGDDLRVAREDEDFAALRGDPEFEALLKDP